MISMHSSTHSSQMNTVGPAMSFLTSCWLLPQKLQYRVLRESPPDLAAGISERTSAWGARRPRGPARKTMLNAPPTPKKWGGRGGKGEKIGRNCLLGGSRLDGRSRPLLEHIVDQTELLGLG